MSRGGFFLDGAAKLMTCQSDGCSDKHLPHLEMYCPDIWDHKRPLRWRKNKQNPAATSWRCWWQMVMVSPLKLKGDVIWQNKTFLNNRRQCHVWRLLLKTGWKECIVSDSRGFYFIKHLRSVQSRSTPLPKFNKLWLFAEFAVCCSANICGFPVSLLLQFKISRKQS